MKPFTILLTAAAAAPACLASSLMRAEAANQQSTTNQLLDALKTFPQGDAEVVALSTAIRQRGGGDNAFSVSTSPCEAASSSPSDCACETLEQLMPDEVTRPQDDQTAYNTLRDKNWSNSCHLPAACFFKPVNKCQVAVALRVISITKSKFAVRSGGHNPNPGFAGVGNDGVTFDMSGFQSIKVSDDKSVVTVGAGRSFGSTQTYLDPLGLAVVSGRNLAPGSGLILGGGHPILGSLTGLAADNVKSFQVVLADSRVVTASQTDNSDLFRALKGGGTNFGIIIEMDLMANSMPRNIWFRNVVYNSSQAAQVLPAFAQVQRNIENDANGGISLTFTPVSFTVAFVYGKYVDSPAVFAPFDNIPAAGGMPAAINDTTLGFIKAQSPPQPPASRDSTCVTSYPDGDLYLDVHKQYMSAVAANKGNGAVFLVAIQTYGAGAVAVGKRNGGNVLGTTAKAQTWWNPISQWTDPKIDNIVHNVLTDLASYIKEKATAKGILDPYLFYNTAAHEQNVLASYGKENLNFLRQVSTKYDGRGTFQKLQNAGFLVSKA